jgi:hypothetical protein
VRRKERAPYEIVGEMRLPSNHAICLDWGGRGRAVKQAGKYCVGRGSLPGAARAASQAGMGGNSLLVLQGY